MSTVVILTVELVLLTGLTKLPVADCHPKCRHFILPWTAKSRELLVSLFRLAFPRAQCVDPE